MTEYKKEIGIAATLAVLAAFGIGLFAITTFPNGGQGGPSTESAVARSIGTVTATATTGVAITQTQTKLACPSSPGASGAPCLYLSGWGFNYSSAALVLNLGYANSSGVATVTLTISYSGNQTNKGFTGLVSLDSLRLPTSGFEQVVNSPSLPNLQRGDRVEVAITGVAGMFFTTTFTFTA